jgi:hypothetical protein
LEAQVKQETGCESIALISSNGMNRAIMCTHNDENCMKANRIHIATQAASDPSITSEKKTP